MNSNTVLKEIHAAAVRKTAENIALTGNTTRAVAIGNAIIKYGQMWTAGLANDGRVDEVELAAICGEFDALVDLYVPCVDSAAVAVAYNGFNVPILSWFGLKFKGIKACLNDWFKLGLACLAVAALSGCVYKGAKVTEGTDLSVGITVPGTDGAASLDILNYLSGFRLGVAKDAIMTVNYTVAETNDYFGCIHTRTRKTVRATVEPCITNDTPSVSAER